MDPYQVLQKTLKISLRASWFGMKKCASNWKLSLVKWKEFWILGKEIGNKHILVNWALVKNKNANLKQQLSDSGFKNVHMRAKLETPIKKLEEERDEIDELRVGIELLELKGTNGHNACPFPLIQFNMFFL